MGGHLAYLPDLQGKISVKVEEAAQWWPLEMVKLPGQEQEVPWTVPPLGGGKLDAAWLVGRYSWRDANGYCS